MQNISIAAQSLWAKKARDGSTQWLPLYVHLSDCAQVARLLWRDWVPEGTKKVIEEGLKPSASALSREELAEEVLVFLCAAHDVGKAMPAFQSKVSAYPPASLDTLLWDRQALHGLSLPDRSRLQQDTSCPHALASLVILQKAGLNRDAGAVLGSHHGKPPDASSVDSLLDRPTLAHPLTKEDKKAWAAAQKEVVAYTLSLSAFSSLEEVPGLFMQAQVLLCGLVIMADWIASNEGYFPYLSALSLPSLSANDLKIRAQEGISRLNLPPYWMAPPDWMAGSLYHERFGNGAFKPNAMQEAVYALAAETIVPGLLIIEAPMGMGKTEAALVAAEIFAQKSGRSGVFFALPTQATSNGIFPRMLHWAQQLSANEAHSIRLAHGRAQFNEDYRRLFEGATNLAMDDEGLRVHSWFEGSKKALLADFVVGTIDQLLMAALQQKHVMLRHLGLAGKVVIIDECHAYDAYMSQYLKTAVKWLGAYGVPVVILSATLPRQKRQSMVDAYLQSDSSPSFQLPADKGYPLLTYAQGEEVHSLSLPSAKEDAVIVTLHPLAEDQLVQTIRDLLAGGGCLGLVVNTVRRAQQFAALFAEHFGEGSVRLLHSGLIAPDRAERERLLMSALGKPSPHTHRPSLCIAIGTQVLEQSLDIDFDVLITDLCPMDLLLQRLGRMHRHRRERPELLKSASCYVLGMDGDEPEEGSAAVYGKYLLMRTRQALPASLTLPKDIPSLVEAVYGEEDLTAQCADLLSAKDKHEHMIRDKRQRASSFRLNPPWPGDETQRLVGFLSSDIGKREGEAAVRDGGERIEVLLLRKTEEGYGFLPPSDPDLVLDPFTPLDNNVARMVAQQKMFLPNCVTMAYNINNTLLSLEELNISLFSAWQASPWLQGELILPLNEDLYVSLSGYRIGYDRFLGLFYEKEEE